MISHRFLSALVFTSIALGTSSGFASPADDALNEYKSVRDDVQAGVRSVGNGGGYAEMQALFISLRLSSWGLLQTPPVRLEIEPNCAGAPITFIGKTTARISTCALYALDPVSRIAKPKRFNEIAAWVLTANQMAAGSSFKSAFDSAWLFFKNFRQREELVEVSFTSGNFIYHDLSVESTASHLKVISLEGKTSTVDITALIESRISCGTGNAVKKWWTENSAPRTSTPDQSQIVSVLSFTCGDSTSWKASLVVAFKSRGDEVDQNSIEVQLVRKFKVTP